MNKLLERYQSVIETRSDRVLLKTCIGEQMTYREFDQKARSLATYLEKRFADTAIVPILSTDNLNYLLTMIACWLTDKIYLPINSSMPSKKIEATLSLIEVDAILTTEGALHLKGIQQIPLRFDKNGIDEACKSFDNDVAYMLSTSGTTGNPKMVQVTFDNLYWLLKEMASTIHFGENDTFIISTPPQFDVSFHESLSFLFGEGSLQFLAAGPPTHQFKQLKEMIINGETTHIALSPTSLKSIFSMTKERIKNSKLTTILLAGEVLPVNLANQVLALLPDIRLFNCYGPTESTIYATQYWINEQITAKTVPIGQPLKGATIQFYRGGNVNASRGEILIGGEGVSKGYYHNRSLTLEKFIVVDGVLYYRTGDLGHQKNGLIFYEGRLDRQIKINGIRIELEEIEQAIQKCLADFTNFSVLKMNNQLVLFSDENLDFAEIQARLKLLLPAYMLPKQYVQVKDFKLTPSHKLDSNYLKNEYEKRFLPRNKLNRQENQISALIRGILNESFLASTENLLLLPRMDSLMQIEIIVALEEKYQIDLPEDFIKEYRSINEITDFLQKSPLVSTNNELDFTETQLANEYANLKAIRDLNTASIRRTTARKTNSYYLQKAYLVDDFNQVLELKVTLPESINSITKIEKIIQILVENNELLRAQFSDTNDLIVYEGYQHIVPVVSSSLIGSLDEKIKSDLEKSVKNCLLWEVYFAEDKNVLHFFFNHLISDQASLNIIEKDIFKIIEDKPISKNSSFTEFVAFIDRNSLMASPAKISRLGFENVVQDNFYSLAYDSKSKYFKVKTPYQSNYENIVYGNFILSKLVCTSQKQEFVSGSTIIDLRKFSDQDFSDVFGDVHTTIPFVFRKTDTESHFNETFNIIYRSFLAGDNVNNTIYQTYPFIPEEMKKYEFYLDDNLKFSNNFLGAIREKDVASTIEGLAQQQSTLAQFSKTKLYVTFFRCGEELIFIPITQHLLDF